jgi:uncharacterized protein YutE (UPF0331/DUF86 family)
MVFPGKISDKFLQLDEYLGILGKVQKTPLQDFRNDKILVGGAKYYLQVSIECCLDVANHIIAAEGFRAPRDYADSFKVLEENGIIEESLCTRLRQMAKFRNRLVHLYGEIDDAYVYEYISTELTDILKFKKVIVSKYLTRL